MQKHIENINKKAKHEFHKLKTHIHDTLNHPSSPQDIALAVAVGVFISALPTFWFHFLIIIALMFIIPVLARNKIPFLLGALVNNTFTSIFVWPIAYYLGEMMLGYGIPFSMQTLMTPAGFWEIYKQLFAGCIVVGIITAIAAYFLTYFGVVIYRKIKKEKK